MRFLSGAAFSRALYGLLIAVFAAAVAICALGCEGLGSFGAPSERTDSREPKVEPEEPPAAITENSAYLGPFGGKLAFQGCTLTVPRGSLRDKDFFTVRYPVKQAENIVNGTNYIVMPTGKTFMRPAIIEITYEPANLPNAVKPDELTIAVFKDGAWRELGISKIDNDRHAVSAPITMLGSFAIVQTQLSMNKANKAPEVTIETAEIPLDDGSLKVNFDAGKSLDPDGTITRYDWDFEGDGLFDYSSREESSASYVFPIVGKYTTVVKVTDNNREPASTIGTVVVDVDELFPPDPPSKLDVIVSAWPPSARVPTSIQFTASAVGGLPPYIIGWDFGTGVTSDIFNPVQRYRKAGLEKVFLYLSDQSGQELAREVTLKLTDIKTPKGATDKPFKLTVLTSAEKGRSPLNVEFTLKFDNAKEPVRWQVYYGDEPEGAAREKGEGARLSHTYKKGGAQLFEIISTDALGKVDTAFTLVFIEGGDSGEVVSSGIGDVGGLRERTNPADAFDAREARVKALGAPDKEDPMTWAFSIDGISTDETPAIEWNFGDGIAVSNAAPIHTFESENLYEVTLELVENNEIKTRRLWIPAYKTPATAIQLPQDTTGIAPFTLKPSAIVTGTEGEIVYSWDFGNGDVSEEPAPKYVYKEAGNYEIKLTVTDKSGNVKAESKPRSINVLPQPVNFTNAIAVVEKEKAAAASKLVIHGLGEEGSGEIPIPAGSKSVTAPFFSSGGGYIGYIADGALRIYESTTGRRAFEFTPDEGVITSAFVSKFGDRVFMNIEKQDGSKTAYFYSSDSGTMTLATEGDNTKVVAVSADASVYLLLRWTEANAATLKRVEFDDKSGKWGEVKELSNTVADAVMSADGKTIVVRKDDRSIVELGGKVDEGLISGTEREKRSLSLSSDGNMAAWLENSGGGDAWDIIAAKRVDDGHLAMLNLTSLIGVKVEELVMLPSGDKLVVYTTYAPGTVLSATEGEAGKSGGDSAGDSAEFAGENNAESKGKTGLFVINLASETPEVTFVAAGSSMFAVGSRQIKGNNG